MQGDVRLRQVALVARELGPVTERIQEAFGLGDPFRDPIVEEFGLENAVFALGDTFIEILAPIRSDSAGSRHLERHGGDAGYMAIFQVADLDATQRRIDDLGIRVIWKAEFPDLVGMHLHPKDVPGAIMSLDWTNPPGSWRWGGPEWTAKEPAHSAGGLTGVTLAVDEPRAVAQRWAQVLGVPLSATVPGTTIPLSPAGQRAQSISFRRLTGSRPGGLRDVSLSVAPGTAATAETLICGVRFVIEAESGDATA